MFVKSKYVENLLKHNGNFCCTWMHTMKSKILIYIGFSPILLEYVTNLHPSLTLLWLDQNITNIYSLLLPPATKLGQGYIFTGVCDSVNSGVCFLPGAGCASSHGSVSSRGGASSWRGRGCFLLGGCLLSRVGGWWRQTPCCCGRYASYWNAFLFYRQSKANKYQSCLFT